MLKFILGQCVDDDHDDDLTTKFEIVDKARHKFLDKAETHLSATVILPTPSNQIHSEGLNELIQASSRRSLDETKVHPLNCSLWVVCFQTSAKFIIIRVD
jgi:hypothetical protein